MIRIDSPTPNDSANGMDPRRDMLIGWLQGLGRYANFELTPASSDASFRRYFRVHFAEGTAIVMDAPPDREDCRPFLHVAKLMQDAKMNVPAILAENLAQGFLLLSDLGTQTYLQVINEDNADDLFAEAIGALVRWQCATRADQLPPYDEALLRSELALFPQWYLRQHLQIELSPSQRAVLDGANDLLVQRALAQPRVYVHRDYMPRNLMVSEPMPGVLDFQDAVCGPISYDVVSLFKDAFLSWPEERVYDWAQKYWQSARRACLPVTERYDDFYADFEWMGLQRHLKVLGIFARINYRDGKPHYLTDTPRFFGYVQSAVRRHTALAPLAQLFDEIEAHTIRQGISI